LEGKDRSRSGFGYIFKTKCRSFGAVESVDAHNENVEAQNGALKDLYSVDYLVVADLHHFDEEQDPDPDTDPPCSEKSDSDPH
jgi:hypothetical protein